MRDYEGRNLWMTSEDQSNQRTDFRSLFIGKKEGGGGGCFTTCPFYSTNLITAPRFYDTIAFVLPLALEAGRPVIGFLARRQRTMAAFFLGDSCCCCYRWVAMEMLLLLLLLPLCFVAIRIFNYNHMTTAPATTTNTAIHSMALDDIPSNQCRSSSSSGTPSSPPSPSLSTRTTFGDLLLILKTVNQDKLIALGATTTTEMTAKRRWKGGMEVMEG